LPFPGQYVHDALRGRRRGHNQHVRQAYHWPVPEKVIVAFYCPFPVPMRFHFKASLRYGRRHLKNGHKQGKPVLRQPGRVGPIGALGVYSKQRGVRTNKHLIFA